MTGKLLHPGSTLQISYYSISLVDMLPSTDLHCVQAAHGCKDGAYIAAHVPLTCTGEATNPAGCNGATDVINRSLNSLVQQTSERQPA